MSDVVKFVQFCPCCFADESSGSWDHVVVSGYCTNCGNGSCVQLPEWAVTQIRSSASWVGKRFYPHDEDRERLEERADLLELVSEFPGREAKLVENEIGKYWRVDQRLPKGGFVSTMVDGEKAVDEEQAKRLSGLRYVSAKRLIAQGNRNEP